MSLLSAIFSTSVQFSVHKCTGGGFCMPIIFEDQYQLILFFNYMSYNDFESNQQ